MAPSDPHAPSPPPAGGLGKVSAFMLPKGSVLWRIHKATYSPLFFGKKAQYRFDDPAAQYGVLYAGVDAHCAFLETYARVPGSQGIILRSQLQAGAISKLETTRPARLADLSAHHLAQLRIDSKIFSHTDYAITQLWSRAFYEHADAFDGLIFHSRHDPSRLAVALFEPVGPAFLQIKQTEGLLSLGFARTLDAIFDLYQFALI